MTLSQALGFFEQTADKLANARSRLDEANAVIAARILNKYRGAVRVDKYTIHKVTKTANSGFSEDYLFITLGRYDAGYGPESDGTHGAIDIDTGYYFMNDFNCWVPAADRQAKLWFAQNIERILQKFAEKYDNAAELNNSAAKQVERVSSDF